MTDDRDQRRKLSDIDYKAVRFAVLVEDRTIREVSNTYGVSTKYTRRLLNQVTTTSAITTVACSGCNYTFPVAEIQAHYMTWTSGGTHELSCGNFAP